MMIKKINYSFKCILFAIFICSVTPFQAFSQVAEEESVKVMARIKDNKVMLRWGVTTPSAWLKANQYGYHIIRYTLSSNGTRLSSPEKKMLTSTPILPGVLSSWENMASTNDYAAILAQAIYGESFIVEGMQEEGDIGRIVNKSKEIEQRFSFALFAADMSFEAAKMAALGFEDPTIQPGEEYLYKIETAIPDTLLKVSSGSVVIKSEKPEPLPAPVDLIAVPNDKTILLTWDYEMFKSTFTSYFVERSDNSKDFTRLGDIPLVNLSDKSESRTQRMQYVDTLAQNDKMYYYRVRGISPFGEESLPSEIVSAKGFKKLSALPHISKYTIEDSNKLNIEWEFLKEAESEITGFELNWSTQEEGPYKVVKSDIFPNVRSTLYNGELAASNYFRIAAIGKNNQRSESMAAFIQTVDSIPPAAPVGLVGTIDTLGIVKLEWQANAEKDILGYRVFKANLEKEEVSQITVSPIQKNNFTDTVAVKSLNSKVFYTIVAVDQRFNLSNYSEKIVIKKPDLVPPSSPIFTDYKIMKDGVFLQWIRSSSNDVVSHQLFRQNTGEPEKGWQLILKTDTITTYTDKNLAANTKYRYAIFAEDDSKLRSLPSTPITVVSSTSVLDNDLVKGFTLVADRENNKINLNWRKMPSEVSEILVYRSKKDEDPILWKQIPGSIHRLEDTSVSPNNIYVYHIKAMTVNGLHSDIKTKEIEF